MISVRPVDLEEKIMPDIMSNNTDIQLGHMEFIFGQYLMFDGYLQPWITTR